jgi:hypothetical protein
MGILIYTLIYILIINYYSNIIRPAKTIVLATSANDVVNDIDTILKSNATILNKMTSKINAERMMSDSLLETLHHLKSRVAKVGYEKLYNQISSNGKISATELCDKLLIGEEEATAFMAYLDSNGDGNVSFDEFKSAMELASDLKAEVFKSIDSFIAQKKETVPLSLDTMNKICDFFNQKESVKNTQIDTVKSTIQSHCEENPVYDAEHLDYLAKTWLMNRGQLEKEIEFATLLTTLARKLIPIVSDYSFNNELIYEYIKNKKDDYVKKQNSTGLFNKIA